MAFVLDGQEVFVDTAQPIDIMQYEMVEFGEFIPHTQVSQQNLLIALGLIGTFYVPTMDPVTDERVAVCGYGPSLLDEIQTIKENGYKTIFTTSGAHDVLMDHGITPTFHVEIDWKPHKSKFTRRANDETTYLMSAVCNTDTLLNVHDKKCALFFVNHGPQIQYPEEAVIMPSGFDAGQQCIQIAYHMGFRNLDLFGFDQSFKDENGERHAGDHGGRIHYMFPAKVGDRIFYTSKTMFTALLVFEHLMKEKSDLNVTIYGDGLLVNFLEERAKQKSS